MYSARCIEKLFISILTMDAKQLIGKKINQYTITKYISSGGFGHVLEARDEKTKEYKALKIPIQTEEKNGLKSIQEELKVYKALISDDSKKNGIINLEMVNDKQNKDRKMLVMDLHGASLQKILHDRTCLRLKSVILIALQALKSLKYIHLNGYVHRDIKPDNFVIDNNDGEKISCIDFGMAKLYKKNGKMVKFKTGSKFCGTARFASIAAHEGSTQSPKDDLESLIYVLVYLYRGDLPWVRLKYKTKDERNKKMLKMKSDITEKELCLKLPKEFLNLMKYTRSLEYSDLPDYDTLIEMFEKLFKTRKYNNTNLKLKID